MKAEIENGYLTIIPQSKTEEYALDCWFKENVHECTGLTINPNLGFVFYKQYKTKLSFKLRLWYYNTIKELKNKFSFVFK